LIEAMLLDVLKDGGIEETRLVAGVALYLTAQLGCADVVVQAGKDGELGFLSGEVDETVLVWLTWKWVDGYTRGEVAGWFGELIFLFLWRGGGAGCDYQVGQKGDFFRAMPVAEGEKRIRSQEQEQLSVWR